MILVDKEIKGRIFNCEEPLISEFKEENLGPISYDLTLDSILLGEEESANYELAPGGFVYVRVKEKLAMPNDLIGRIEEKNSRMRMGLVVSGPTYQPGHKTAIFLRVQNISNNDITIRKGAGIAQIVFETLSTEPEIPYNQDTRASYNNEFQYSEFGNYESEYRADIKKIEHVKENLDDKETQIYGNVLTFMGILMGIFSIVTLNLEAFAKAKITINYIMVMNLSITLSIEFLMSIILIFVNKKISKSKVIACGISIVCTAVLLILFAMN